MPKVVDSEDYMKLIENGDPFQYLHLQPGEIPCDNCGATGDDLSPNHGDGYHTGTCKKCLGYGKLNWIHNIFGKM